MLSDPLFKVVRNFANLQALCYIEKKDKCMSNVRRKNVRLKMSLGKLNEILLSLNISRGGEIYVKMSLGNF